MLCRSFTHRILQKVIEYCCNKLARLKPVMKSLLTRRTVYSYWLTTWSVLLPQRAPTPDLQSSSDDKQSTSSKCIDSTTMRRSTVHYKMLTCMRNSHSRMENS